MTMESTAALVAFKAQFAGTMDLTPPVPPGFPVNVSGTGEASYLGDSTNTAYVTFVEMMECENGPGFVVQNAGTLRSTEHTDDTITVAITDRPCPTGPNLYSGTSPFTVTGGTGRFAGATGHGSFTGTGDFAKLTFTYVFDGLISPPAGS
ncbi:MAG: hypothetical protein ACREN2_01100 [Candidatus Dormibacteria bacterium]